MGRGLFADRNCSRHRPTFRRARGGRAVSLHAKSALPREPSDGSGIGVLASRWGFIFLVLANWIFVYRLILREEKALRQSQGESYRAYCETVPRFWPSLRPRVPPGNRRPQWGQALGGESFVWVFGLAELLVAMTLRPLAALIAFPLGFLAHFVITRRIQKRGRRKIKKWDLRIKIFFVLLAQKRTPYV